jgi:hypothetical protein
MRIAGEEEERKNFISKWGLFTACLWISTGVRKTDKVMIPVEVSGPIY